MSRFKPRSGVAVVNWSNCGLNAKLHTNETRANLGLLS